MLYSEPTVLDNCIQIVSKIKSKKKVQSSWFHFNVLCKHFTLCAHTSQMAQDDAVRVMCVAHPPWWHSHYFMASLSHRPHEFVVAATEFIGDSTTSHPVTCLLVVQTLHMHHPLSLAHAGTCNGTGVSVTAESVVLCQSLQQQALVLHSMNDVTTFACMLFGLLFNVISDDAIFSTSASIRCSLTFRQ